MGKKRDLLERKIDAMETQVREYAKGLGLGFEMDKRVKRKMLNIMMSNNENTEALLAKLESSFKHSLDGMAFRRSLSIPTPPTKH